VQYVGHGRSDVYARQVAKKRVEALKAARSSHLAAARTKIAAKAAAKHAASAAAAATALKVKIGEDDAAAKQEIADYFDTLDKQARLHPPPPPPPPLPSSSRARDGRSHTARAGGHAEPG
jgi:hypothetical protein